MVRTQAERLRYIDKSLSKTYKSSDGVFLESLQTFEKVSDVEIRRNLQIETKKQYFKVLLL